MTKSPTQPNKSRSDSVRLHTDTRTYTPNAGKLSKTVTILAPLSPNHKHDMSHKHKHDHVTMGRERFPRFLKSNLEGSCWVSEQLLIVPYVACFLRNFDSDGCVTFLEY